MTPLHNHCLDLDLHRLDLRFADSRLVEPQAVARLAESIERCGQIVPCIVVAVPGGEGGGLAALVLIDGYRPGGGSLAPARPRHRRRRAMVLRPDPGAAWRAGARAGSSVRQHRAGLAAA